MVRYTFALAAALLTAALVSALPAVARHSGRTAVHVSAVNATEGKPAEFRITLSKKTVPKGTVNFLVINKGALPHDFKINGHKTKLLSPGQAQTLKVTFLKAGKYPYLCTVTGHAAAGMKGILTVS
jgi:plastocyanin